MPLACKYVRREIRDLVTDDRERFLSALEVAHRMPYDEGQATFGGKYMDAIGLTRKHLARMTLDRCTPWHNGKVFFTAHAAFTLEMEQSLQTIDPTIAMPYWDYTIDAEVRAKEGGRTRRRSLINDRGGVRAREGEDASSS